MDLHRLTLATGKTEDTGEAEYWIGAVRDYEDMFGFELYDFDQKSIAQFLYPDRVTAEIAHGAMFKVLEHVVLVAAQLPE